MFSQAIMVGILLVASLLASWLGGLWNLLFPRFFFFFCICVEVLVLGDDIIKLAAETEC